MAPRRTKEESAALKSAIIAHYTTTDAGMNAIAKALGCSSKYVSRVLIDGGIPIVDKPRQIPWNREAKAVRNQDILRMHEAGVSRREIARQVGLSPDQVANILIAHGVVHRQALGSDPTQRTRRTRAESAALKAAIVDRYLHTTRTLSTIAVDLDCNRAYISQVLQGMVRPPHRFRPKPLPPRPNKELRNQQIAVLFESGMGVAAIAERYGITGQHVSRIAKEMGCSPRIPRTPPEHVAERNRRVRVAFDGGATKTELAQEFGLKGNYVRDILVKEKS